METKRLKIHIATKEEMESFISSQENEILKQAYTEMLDASIKHPNLWEWYAIWMIELSDGTHIGEICFKGINQDGSAEIGYGIAKEYQNNGYATEAVNAAAIWALNQPNISKIYAEIESNNIPSKRVAEKCGFVPSGKTGQEGPIFEKKK